MTFEFGFALIACITLAFILYFVRIRAGILKKGVRVQGEIVDLEPVGLDPFHYYPVVRFRTHTGQLLTLTSSDQAHVLEFKKGQQVEVSYLPATPEEFIIVSGLDILVEPDAEHESSRCNKSKTRTSGPPSKSARRRW